MYQGMEGWREGEVVFHQSAPPLCLQNVIISIYPPPKLRRLAETSRPHTPYGARIIQSPPSPISAVNHHTSRRHPTTLLPFLPRVSSPPQLIKNGNERQGKEKYRKRREQGRAADLSGDET